MFIFEMNNLRMFLAEREGFEPPIALRLCLISSQVENRRRLIFIRVSFCAKPRC